MNIAHNTSITANDYPQEVVEINNSLNWPHSQWQLDSFFNGETYTTNTPLYLKNNANEPILLPIWVVFPKNKVKINLLRASIIEIEDTETVRIAVAYEVIKSLNHNKEIDIHQLRFLFECLNEIPWKVELILWNFVSFHN